MVPPAALAVDQPRGVRYKVLATEGSFPPENRSSLTIEYPANGSFFRPQQHTRSVPKEGLTPLDGMQNIRHDDVSPHINGQATKGVR